MGEPGGPFIYLWALFALLKSISLSWSAAFHYILEALRETIGWIAAAAVAVWFSLVGTDKGPAPNPSDFQIAMERQGLTRSPSIHGSVWAAGRDPDGRLTLTGWAVDLELGQPVSVFAFVGGNFEPIAIAKGPRDDVTRVHLPLTTEQVNDVIFAGRIERPVTCGPDSIFKVVAINQRKQLGIIYRVLNPGCGAP